MQTTLRAQSSATLQGSVRDSTTGEALAGARIELRSLHTGAIADTAGNYHIDNLPSGVLGVEVHLLGYAVEARTITLVAGERRVLNFRLRTQNVQGKEVIVQGEKEREAERTSVSRIMLTPQIISSVPAIGGESDLFRVLQLLPGVKALSEVSSGLYIRGGAPDQNLILLDHNVVYNPSHLFGFFSTFNTDAIKDVDLIKGGYPPEYGGRLTGVLNVTTREGDRNALHGKTSISLISARQTLEFPLLNGSALISGRRTYVDAFLNLTHADKLFSDSIQLPRYYFYDLNAKIDQDLGPKDRLSISGYLGADHLHVPSNGVVDITLTWGNQLASADWTHIFSPTLFARTFAGYSAYSSQSLGNLTSSPFEFDNGIQEFSISEDLDWRLNNQHDIRMGASVSRFQFTFFNTLGTTNKPLNDTGGVPNYLAAYAQDEWKPNDKITATGGMRAEWLDVASAITIDPRLTIAYQLSPLWTLKASTGMYHQFLHLVTAGEFTFFDLWVPGTSPLPPSQSTQYILGISGYPVPDVIGDAYFASCELYYKRLKNIVEYDETKFLTNDITQLFPRGTGEAYGLELLFRKQVGDLNGWIGYTLSWVTEQIPQLNNGQAFYPKYDQRHDIQLVLNYKLSDRWQIGATWSYATGQAYTSVLGYYHVGFDETGYEGNLDIPGMMGALRLPDYHRADASLTYSFSFFGKPAKASLDVFNLYSHRNVWFRVVDTQKQPPEISDVLLLPIIPTLGMEVSY
ncbi:MAG: TonB-dependent receptor [Bacteroidota bacterium]|nr:TonB-dependent receptor [Bacteroidota bacterium]MDP4232859.1 TonB-dependent receptor [Bacteroidota bacterium]MDP4241903.1 TonB-dependent receptor [Bacteroidota bacterium]MDP4288228.1 TonB-dependent receptor [Bacteroidota bacterium]